MGISFYIHISGVLTLGRKVWKAEQPGFVPVARLLAGY